MRTMGLDIGDKKIGIAISDQDEILATPCTVIRRETDQDSINAILELINDNNVEKIVVGLPYSMNGTVGTQANKVIDFVKEFSKYTNLEIVTCDERLSTLAGQRLLVEAGHSPKKANKKADAAAAAFILQGYLDSLKIM